MPSSASMKLNNVQLHFVHFMPWVCTFSNSWQHNVNLKNILTAKEKEYIIAIVVVSAAWEGHRHYIVDFWFILHYCQNLNNC